MKKLLLTLILAVQFVAVANVTPRVAPAPGCGPCDPLEGDPAR
jgi:hypothetical protein